MHALGGVINPVEFVHGDLLILPGHAHTTDSAEHMVGSTSSHVCVAAHDTRRSIHSYSNFCNLALECFSPPRKHSNQPGTVVTDKHKYIQNTYK